MSKHTPAPWTNLPRLQCIPICGQHEVGLSLGFISSSNPERTAEGKANARLIAAAPDLLEALEAMIVGACAVAVHHAGERATLQMAVDMATKVIARAKGESQ
jgi:hypothetical protein